MLSFFKRFFGGGRQNKIKYSPVIGSARKVREYRIGKYTAELLTDIESTGFIEYTHILSVYGDDGNPVYFMASEVNSMAQVSGSGSHFLGVFDESGHGNLGSSDNWADIEKFTTQAVKIVKEHFGV